MDSPARPSFHDRKDRHDGLVNGGLFGRRAGVLAIFADAVDVKRLGFPAGDISFKSCQLAQDLIDRNLGGLEATDCAHLVSAIRAPQER